MKTAKAYAVAIAVECPHCGSNISNRSGSQMFTAEDVPTAGIVTCDTCGKESKLPKRAPIYWTA